MGIVKGAVLALITLFILGAYIDISADATSETTESVTHTQEVTETIDTYTVENDIDSVIEVTLDGVVLTETTDYTFTGDTITLDAGLTYADGEELVVEYEYTEPPAIDGASALLVTTVIPTIIILTVVVGLTRYFKS